MINRNVLLMRIVYACNVLCCAAVGSLSLWVPHVGVRTLWNDEDTGRNAMQVGSTLIDTDVWR